jgi:hypothetical protein
MILSIKRSTIWVLFTAVFLQPAQFALSSETTTKKESTETKEVEADDAIVIFKITSPATRNPLPAEIIDRMRKELIVLMGVEPQDSAETDKN